MNRRDWEQMYMNKHTADPQTFSEKWRWHYSQQPYVRVPEASDYSRYDTSERSYKRSGPKYSEMYKTYKRQYVDNVFGYGFVDSMGDL